MGNHEFCTECHDSSSHFGSPCNPEKLKQTQELKKKESIARREEKRSLSRLVEILHKEGFAVYFNEYDNLVVRDFRPWKKMWSEQKNEKANNI